ncbi:MAG: R3H domain-containing nucleic acid-binding protein [Candidatus Paceibacterota bacterium]
MDKEKELEILKKTLELMGFGDFSANYDSENGRFSVFVNEGEYFKKLIPNFVSGLNCVFRIISDKNRKEGDEYNATFIDVNNYRKERDNIILELARAAARKSATIKEEVSLPPMNGYERRLIHVELASRPDVSTESVGEGKERYIIIKPVTPDAPKTTITGETEI